MSILMETGCSTETRDSFDWTPLYRAVERGLYKSVQCLVAHGCNVNNPCRGEIALHCAARKGHIEIARLLVANGSKINYVNAVQDTPLHIAVTWGHNEIVKLLVDGGCNTNIQNHAKESALHAAVKTRNTEAVTLFVNHGCDTSLRDDNNMTAIEVAVKLCAMDMVNLIRRGCMEHLAGGEFSCLGFTALLYAIKEQHFDTVACMVKEWT